MKKVKNLSLTEAEKLKKLSEEKELRDFLTSSPDQLIRKKGSNKSLDHRLEKVELINGDVINLRQLQIFIDTKINEYSKKFRQDFYLQIFRLNGWKIPANGKISYKPSIVARWTNDIIYGRFPKEILPHIQQNNKFDEYGMRAHRHYQFLNPEGVKKLELYIEESIKIMMKCSYWDEFVKEHAIAFGHPFQTSLINI